MLRESSMDGEYVHELSEKMADDFGSGKLREKVDTYLTDAGSGRKRQYMILGDDTEETYRVKSAGGDTLLTVEGGHGRPRIAVGGTDRVDDADELVVGRTRMGDGRDVLRYIKPKSERRGPVEETTDDEVSQQVSSGQVYVALKETSSGYVVEVDNLGRNTITVERA